MMKNVFFFTLLADNLYF